MESCCASLQSRSFQNNTVESKNISSIKGICPTKCSRHRDVIPPLYSFLARQFLVYFLVVLTVLMVCCVCSAMKEKGSLVVFGDEMVEGPTDTSTVGPSLYFLSLPSRWKSKKQLY